jgi:hypothetical protein
MKKARLISMNRPNAKWGPVAKGWHNQVAAFILVLTTMIGLLKSGSAFAEPREERDFFGIWCMDRGKVEPAELKGQYPWLKGAFIMLKWSQLEPQPGQFDWSYFDAAMVRDARAGLYVLFLVWAGPASPDWLYQEGVPIVKTGGKGHPSPKPHDTFPFYLDPKYKECYHRMMRAVAAHVDTLPADVRKQIVCIQSAEGSTGDQGAYKGKPSEDKFAITPEQWSAFKQEAWLLLDNLYRTKQPAIHLLINVGTRDEITEGDSAWLLQHLPDAYRKATGPCQMYQMSDELRRFHCCDPLFNELDAQGNVCTRCRGELSLVDDPWFQEAAAWNMYWLNLWNLHFGVDMFMQRAAVFEQRQYEEGLVFFSRYAGHKDPATSPGAWCALRDGLDAADHERFPDDKFGKGEKAKGDDDAEAGVQRGRRIVDAFAAYGAVQGDPEGIAQRAPKALNDAGWNIWRGNYERYLVQREPNATSQGYWRVGPKDQPYGRFARGFDSQSGKNILFFDILDRFFQDKPLNAAYPVKVRVVYFDKGNGTWELQYDAVSGVRTGLKVQNTDTGRWKDVVAELKDGYFGNRCPKSSDLMLVNTGQQNTLFHMVEVMRELPGVVRR